MPTPEAHAEHHPSGRILVINPGSTSTKFAVYTREGSEWEQTARHSAEELKAFAGRAVLEQKDYRARQIAAELAHAGYDVQHFDAVAGRGGLLPPLPSGTYEVNAAMLEELRLAQRGEHASNLGAVLADWFARQAGVKAYVVDPVSVDEWQECARLSGSALLPRVAQCHALNTKAVAKRYAAEVGRRYEDLRLVVAHLGSGNSISAHADGHMIDNNTGDDGPFGVDRCGTVPTRGLVELCCRSGMSERELKAAMFGEGGIYSYLGTRDMMQVEERIAAGDKLAERVLEAMIYQVAKEAGAMAAVLQGRVDAVLVTGGMARSEYVETRLREYLHWIAPVRVYPGENELEALAQGVFRVMDGTEEARQLKSRAHV